MAQKMMPATSPERDRQSKLVPPDATPTILWGDKVLDLAAVAHAGSERTMTAMFACEWPVVPAICCLLGACSIFGCCPACVVIACTNLEDNCPSSQDKRHVDKGSIVADRLGSAADPSPWLQMSVHEG